MQWIATVYCDYHFAISAKNQPLTAFIATMIGLSDLRIGKHRGSGDHATHSRRGRQGFGIISKLTKYDDVYHRCLQVGNFYGYIDRAIGNFDDAVADLSLFLGVNTMGDGFQGVALDRGGERLDWRCRPSSARFIALSCSFRA
ncbi:MULTISPECIES: hypothetical protein [Mesorhizobium]|uniref:hypothetical protein n=1 Tax=Mesorhizobium australicum TaxID=536018 RepID=UPI00333C3B4A